MSKAGGVSREHSGALAPKLGFAGLHLLILATVAGIALGGWGLPDPARAQILLAVAGLYFLRHLVTLFVLLKRKVGYSEVLGLAAFIALFEIGFCLLGGGVLRGAAIPFGWLDWGALALVLAGSWLNTGSELQRWQWKKRPEAKGHCYTGGLFAHSMHVNYFGDTVLFTGWALLTHSALAFAIPVFMALSFVFYHIPALDAYLAERYGDEFRNYAARTAKFVPYLY